ncbi:MAG: hypothetical protein ACFCUR_06185 [Rhodomicrobiaceae bacterium]
MRSDDPVDESKELPHEFLARVAKGGMVKGKRPCKTHQLEAAEHVRAFTEPVFNPFGVGSTSALKQAIAEHRRMKR